MTSPKIPYDNYPTPDRLAKAIVDRVKARYQGGPPPPSLIEPSAGSGVFVRHMKEAWPETPIVAVEVRPNEQELLAAGALQVITSDWAAWIKYAKDFYEGQGKPVLIIGNPPFSLAQRHIEAALENLPSESTVSLLLRFSFFGSKKRVPFWNGIGGMHLQQVEPIIPRPSFVKGSQDNSEYALFTWIKNWNKDWDTWRQTRKPSIGQPILWEKRNVRPRK